MKCLIVPIGARVFSILDTGWFSRSFYRRHFRLNEYIGSSNTCVLSLLNRLGRAVGRLLVLRLNGGRLRVVRLVPGHNKEGISKCEG